ncbi:MAG: TauD/TfdA family dioxygenase [Ilumatobacteraceae bacterium]
MTIADEVDLQPLDDLIEPRWWTGTPWLDADGFTIDCTDYAMDHHNLRESSDLATRMRETYDASGLVLLVNTGLTELADMRAFAQLVVDAEMNYDGGANPRDRIEPNVYEVGAPLEAWLHYHHEMAYVGRSTRVVSFLCRDALPGRGSTFVSDSIAATEAILATEFGQKLKELGVCYVRNLTDRDAFADRVEFGVYNHWQKSFGTDDPRVAEQRARSQRLAIDWGPDRLMKTRYYCPAYEYAPKLDRNVLYSSIADHGMWFDTWPLVQHLPYEDRPLNMTFGDDTPFTREDLELFVDVYDRFGTPIDWRVGDVAVIDNYRFAHGRPGIHLGEGESRTLGVLLGEQYDRVGVDPGKW